MNLREGVPGILGYVSTGQRMLIVRLKGGLGNQMFEYAAARRLAIANDVELVLDTKSGFSRDFEYGRSFELGMFSIPCRLATPSERLEPFERHRRAALRLSSRMRSFEDRKYLEQESIEFDSRLLCRRVRSRTYLDGLWQSEGYFYDVKDVIRQDLTPSRALDAGAQYISLKIRDSNVPVAVHFRDFDAGRPNGGNNVGLGYYTKAVDAILRKVMEPHFFVFSDTLAEIPLPDNMRGFPVTIVERTGSPNDGFTDLVLMSQCHHFITANSTFSWWAAWLGESETALIFSPSFGATGRLTAWNFPGLIPRRWVTL